MADEKNTQIDGASSQADSNDPATPVTAPTTGKNSDPQFEHNRLGGDPQPGSGPGDAPDGGVSTQAEDRTPSSDNYTNARINKGAEGLTYPETVPSDDSPVEVRTNNPSGYPAVEGNTFEGRDPVGGYTGLNQSGKAGSGQVEKHIYTEVPDVEANHNNNHSTRKYPPESFPENPNTPADPADPQTPNS